jgi:hypothetical protein
MAFKNNQNALQSKSELLQRAKNRWPQLVVLDIKRVKKGFRFLVRCFECQTKHWMAFNCSGRCFPCGNILRAQRRAATMAQRVEVVIHQLVRNQRVSLPWKPKVSGYIYVPQNYKMNRLHRLVMEAFLGHVLDKNIHVHHKNGHRTDCRIKNLECRWCTTHGAGITRAEARQFLRDTQPRRKP